MFDNLWVEKYRPKTLDDIILSDENSLYFKNLVNEIPHLLFVGNSGIGKTTLARIIVEDILQCQYLYINASDENGIDTIRSKVTNFSQTKSFDSRIKVVILDEADGLTLDAQAAMRNKMEETWGHTRFILTANYKHKIIPAIQSRVQYFDLTPPFIDVVRRVSYILKQENIKVAEEKDSLVSLIKQNYPDIRKILNNVQKAVINKTLTKVNTIDDSFSEKIHNAIFSKNVLELRKYLIENENEFQGDYHNLLKQYLNYIYKTDIKDSLKRDFIINISEYMYRDVTVMDKEINAFACICMLEKLV